MNWAVARSSTGHSDLERDPTRVLQVVGQVDHGHATLPDLPQDPVAVTARVLQSRGYVRRAAQVLPGVKL
jgi:hypothetical protein